MDASDANRESHRYVTTGRQSSGTRRALCMRVYNICPCRYASDSSRTCFPAFRTVSAWEKPPKRKTRHLHSAPRHPSRTCPLGGGITQTRPGESSEETHKRLLGISRRQRHRSGPMAREPGCGSGRRGGRVFMAGWAGRNAKRAPCPCGLPGNPRKLGRFLGDYS